MHTGCQWHKLPIRKNISGIPEISYIQVFKHFHQWILNHSILNVFIASIESLNNKSLLDTSILYGDGTSTTAKKGGDNLGRNGHKHHKGDKVVAICDRNYNVVAPFITASGNLNESHLFPETFASLKTIVKHLNINISVSNGGWTEFCVNPFFVIPC